MKDCWPEAREIDVLNRRFYFREIQVKNLETGIGMLMGELSSVIELHPHIRPVDQTWEICFDSPSGHPLFLESRCRIGQMIIGHPGGGHRPYYEDLYSAKTLELNIDEGDFWSESAKSWWERESEIRQNSPHYLADSWFLRFAPKGGSKKLIFYKI